MTPEFSGLSNWEDGAAISQEAESWERNRLGVGEDWELSGGQARFETPEVKTSRWEGPEVGIALNEKGKSQPP